MKSSKLSFLGLILIALTASLAACGRATPAPIKTPTPVPSQTVILLPAGDSERSLTVDGLERSYLLHIPPLVRSNQPVPLMFVFHGYSMHAADMVTLTGMNSLADSNQFLLVYPSGTGPDSELSWNAGDCCGYASEANVDEMAFIRGMIADVGRLAAIDPARIYATGFSNGGFLSYRIACEMADTFAAVAPVGGVLKFPACQPANKISLLHIHGLSDEVVPFDVGGKAGLDLFTSLDGCSGSSSVDVNPVTTHTIYTACAGNTAVELYTIKTMGHMWPNQYILPATQIIWEFFKAHPKK